VRRVPTRQPASQNGSDTRLTCVRALYGPANHSGRTGPLRRSSRSASLARTAGRQSQGPSTFLVRACACLASPRATTSLPRADSVGGPPGWATKSLRLQERPTDTSLVRCRSLHRVLSLVNSAGSCPAPSSSLEAPTAPGPFFRGRFGAVEGSARSLTSLSAWRAVVAPGPIRCAGPDGDALSPRASYQRRSA
jgi:hypothetical protein